MLGRDGIEYKLERFASPLKLRYWGDRYLGTTGQNRKRPKRKNTMNESSGAEQSPTSSIRFLRTLEIMSDSRKNRTVYDSVCLSNNADNREKKSSQNRPESTG